MVEDLVKEKIREYQSKTIKTDIRLIVEVSKIYENDVEKVYNALENIGFHLKKINQVVDSYLIITQGSKIDPNLKKIFEDSSFFDENETVISDLAKIYFFCDSISFDGSQILIKKDIALEAEDDSPDIDISKAIIMTLQKIKYNKIDDKAIIKIQELGNYSKYKDLMNLLLKAVEYSSRIKLLNDDECKINIDELRELLK